MVGRKVPEGRRTSAPSRGASVVWMLTWGVAEARVTCLTRAEPFARPATRGTRTPPEAKPEAFAD